MNLLEFNAVDGGDTTGTAYYKSNLWPQSAGNSPRRASAALRGERHPANPDHHLAIGAGGQVRPSRTTASRPIATATSTVFFASRPPLPDPLRPEVQDLLLRQPPRNPRRLREEQGRAGRGLSREREKSASATGRGTLGTSDQYTATARGCGRVFARHRHRRARDEADALPVDQGTNCWEKWLDWRCKRTHDFWLRCRDEVRKLPAGPRPLRKLRHAQRKRRRGTSTGRG